MSKRDCEKMNCDVILTFDKIYYGGTQAFINFDLSVTEHDANLRHFISRRLFARIARQFAAKNFVYEKKWLATVSTCCDWSVYRKITGNARLIELGNGKWNFTECNKWVLISGSLTHEIKNKYGFGTSTDSSWFWNNQDDIKEANFRHFEYICRNSKI